MQRKLTCHICDAPLILSRAEVATYHWQCPGKCLPALDTDVQVNEAIDDLPSDESGSVEFNASHFFPPLSQSRIATAQVFMPQILYHFIECTWGTCYNSLYINVLLPYLNAPQVLDYVLRSSVLRDRPGVQTGKSGARLYPELHYRLQGVKSQRIRDYLAQNFHLENH